MDNETPDIVVRLKELRLHASSWADHYDATRTEAGLAKTLAELIDALLVERGVNWDGDAERREEYKRQAARLEAKERAAAPDKIARLEAEIAELKKLYA